MRMKRKALILSRAAHTAKNGSALLAVFWGIIVLTMAVAGWFFWLQQRVQEHGQDSRSIEALAMAHSGIAMALNPKVDRYSSLLQTEIEPGLGFRVTMESEGSRLNLKVLLEGMLQKNGSCDSIFRKWLEWVIGVEDVIERDRLVDCLLDYVDPDNIARIHGQEDNKDYHPANRMILSLDELKRIPGMEPLLAYPGWKDLLTLDSSKVLDLMEAPEELLRVLPGFSEVQVQRLLQIRVGMDGVLHTEDDPKYKSTDALLKQLGMGNEKRRAELEALVGVNESTIRIQAEGYSGKVIRQVQVVVRKGTGTPQILSWIE
jgi:type II secretory pathway component PulK